MPFTPFHMGPALLLKAAVPQRFSLLVFGVSQVLIDLEPLVRIVRGDPQLHGFTHTITGAILVATIAAPVGRSFANWLLDALRRDSAQRWAISLLARDVSWTVALGSAALGTGSHLVLDGIMHSDMSPFDPITAANPLLGRIGLSTLHLLCLGTGIIGSVVLLIRGALAAHSDRARPAQRT